MMINYRVNVCFLHIFGKFGRVVRVDNSNHALLINSFL